VGYVVQTIELATFDEFLGELLDVDEEVEFVSGNR
jgi:hypothetical protein